MHAAIKYLANKYHIPISDRVCGGHPVLQPVWNGSDLASYWCKATWDYWGETVTSVQDIPLNDHDFLHEIAHWVAAAPEQRDLPEYGLGAIAFTTYHLGEENMPDVVGLEEGSIQERLCWFLCCYWGTKYNISAILSDSPNYACTWEEYLDKKIQESLHYKPEITWQALIRFQKILDTHFFQD